MLTCLALCPSSSLLQERGERGGYHGIVINEIIYQAKEGPQLSNFGWWFPFKDELTPVHHMEIWRDGYDRHWVAPSIASLAP